jgi:urease accessory protein
VDARPEAVAGAAGAAIPQGAPPSADAVPARPPADDAPAALPAATLLRLIWLASPALPVGGFSYSEGFEAAVDAGRVGGEPGARDWLLAQLELTLARGDGPALAQAMRAWRADDRARVGELNDWVEASRESAEFRLQAEQMGRSLVEWLKNGEHAADPRIAALAALPPAPTWPVAFALAAVLGGADERDALLAFGLGWAENLAQAAMKSVPLGQAAAQRIVSALAAALPPAVERALGCDDAGRVAFAPMLAVLSARHEAQYSRLFRS